MWSTAVVLLAASTALSAYPNGSFPQPDDVDGFVPINGQRFDLFDWQLCSELARKDPGNVIISPISIKLLLKMLYEGSSGASSAELSRVLSLPKDKTATRTQSSAILHSLQTPNPDYKLEIGSKIFVTENVSPKNWYQRILNLYYHAYIEKLDFADSEAASARINTWVEHITHNQIKDFMTPGDGLESTVMLLVNAIYFKGSWVMPFPMGDTHPGKFKTPQGLRDVHYMTQSNYFYYSRYPQLQSQILRLPYLGHKFSMYIILPEKEDGLDELIRNIKPSELRKRIWLLEETSLEVHLPKFKFSYKTELKDIMRQLGIRRIFESYNDMKGLTKNSEVKDLVVSSVVQKAAIDVNEEGSVAAAATEIQLTNKFGGNDEVFNASHPFLFFIEDESTGTVVFVGKVICPEGYTEMEPPPLETTTTRTTKRTAPPSPHQRKPATSNFGSKTQWFRRLDYSD